ncbi:MAG: hypothetical protein ACI8PZ_004997 [Myxococcota bacterium]|jgi:hypothetical protein
MLSFVLLLALAACNGSGDVAPRQTGTPTDATPTPTTPTTTTPGTPTGYGGPPEGLQIDSITFNQGVAITLVEDGDPIGTQMPIVTDRPAWVRVFVDVDEDIWEERDIIGQLTVKNGGDEVVLEDVSTIRADSDPFTKRTTLNFDIEADLVRERTTYSVELVEADATRGEGKKRQTTWSSDDNPSILVGETDDLEVVIIPIQYDSDGSGRLPDVSDPQIQRIADLFYSMYPVPTITITVSDPAPWPYYIGADGSGWGELLDAISNARSAASVADNVYYYGLFVPDDSFESFCRRGCVLGLSYLAFSERDVWARASIGVGWSGDVTSETMAHEVGHAHGREHAPCGLYDWDRNYPHDNAALGAWGYDLLTREMFPPLTTRDVMSYCSPIWVSDYTYSALFSRIRALGPAGAQPLEERRWPSFTVDGDGVASRRGQDVPVRGMPGGQAVDVELLDGAGQVIGEQRGYVLPYGHISGGRVAVDVSDDVQGLRLVDPSVVQRDTVLFRP